MMRIVFHGERSFSKKKAAISLKCCSLSRKQSIEIPAPGDEN